MYDVFMIAHYLFAIFKECERNNLHLRKACVWFVVIELTIRALNTPVVRRHLFKAERWWCKPVKQMTTSLMQLKIRTFLPLEKKPLDSKLCENGYRWLLCVLVNRSIDKLPEWFLIFKDENFSHLHLNAFTKSRIRQLPGNLERQFLLKRLEVKIYIHLLNQFMTQ